MWIEYSVLFFAFVYIIWFDLTPRIQTYFTLWRIRQWGHSDSLAGKWTINPKSQLVPSWLKIKLAEAQFYRCLLCFRMLPSSWELDHRIPRGLRRVMNILDLQRVNNFQIVCPNCHRDKTNAIDNFRALGK